MKTLIDIRLFGFENYKSFFESLVHPEFLKVTIPVGLCFASVAVSFESYIGMKPLVYLSFVTLFLMEFYTGVKASRKRGEAIISYKLPGAATKAAFYTIILAILNTFAVNNGDTNLLFFKINIYEFVYYFIFNIVILSLLISVFENARDLGYKESSRIIRMLFTLFEKMLNIQEEQVKQKNHNWEKTKTDDKINGKSN